VKAQKGTKDDRAAAKRQTELWGLFDRKGREEDAVNGVSARLMCRLLSPVIDSPVTATKRRRPNVPILTFLACPPRPLSLYTNGDFFGNIASWRCAITAVTVVRYWKFTSFILRQLSYIFFTIVIGLAKFHIFLNKVHASGKNRYFPEKIGKNWSFLFKAIK